MKLKSIDRVCGLSKKDFLEQYFKPQKPVIIEDAIIAWNKRIFEKFIF